MTSSPLSHQRLSELIKTAREAHGLTQTAFGQFFTPTIAQPTIARWEKGDLLPDRKHFPKIASLLNLTLEEFLELNKEQLALETSMLTNSQQEVYVPNQRHLNVLNRGVKAWHRWREKNHTIFPHLAGAKPKEQYLDEIDFHNADLRGINLKGKSLRSSNFQGADLTEADLSHADLSNANLQGVNLRKANLNKAILNCTNLQNADLREAILKESYLFQSNLRDANLADADLTQADLRHVLLNGANLENAMLKYCAVYGVSAWDVKLKGATQEKLFICPHNTQSTTVNDLRNAYIKSIEIANREDGKIMTIATEFQNALEEQNLSFKDKLNQIKATIGDENED